MFSLPSKHMLKLYHTLRRAISLFTSASWVWLSVLTKNRQFCVRDILPHVHRIQGFGEPPELFDHPSCLIQGYSPQLYQMDLAGHGQGAKGCFDGGPGHDAQDNNRFDDRLQTPACGRNPTRCGRYARLDHNHHIYNPNVQCKPCKCIGHPAAMCDMLAQALFLEKYMKHLLNDATKERVETAWLNRWRLLLGNPSCTPRTVMRVYLDKMDMMVEDLDGQLCWDCLPEGDKPFEELDLPGPE
jgi:hypothetical protein